MKKRYLMIGTAVILSAFLITGCGRDNQTLAEYAQENAEINNENAAGDAGTATVGTVTEKEDETEKEPETAKPDSVRVLIFRSNSDATGFEGQEVLLPGYQPEYILEELAKVNVVSYDTKVLDFSVTQDGKHLTLDLSAEFSNYINMMGTTGEYIVVGSLVNTFLRAYDAEDILITAEGKVLETSHTLYDKPLTVFEETPVSTAASDDKKKEPMAYRLKDTSYKQEEKEIYYPQFDGMPDQKLQDTWNQAILDIAMLDFVKKNAPDYDSYSVDYKIGFCTADKLSFLFTKKIKTNGKSSKLMYALTFDMVSGKCLRFGDLSDVMETVSYNMANHGYYKIVNSDLDREAYDEHFDRIIKDAGDYREMFLRYDYDLSDLSVKPEGYMYINGDGELEILMNPVKGLSDDQIEIRTGVMVR